MQEPLVPQDEFILSKSQMLVRISQNAVDPDIPLKCMEGKTSPPKKISWVIRRTHGKDREVGMSIRSLQDNTVR